MLFFIFHLLSNVEYQLYYFKGDSTKSYDIANGDIMALLWHEFHDQPQMVVYDVILVFLVVFGLEKHVLVVMIDYVEQLVHIFVYLELRCFSELDVIVTVPLNDVASDNFYLICSIS